eukprot:scaffold226819_cov39-Tisochrysis_lutea.AAC.1
MTIQLTGRELTAWQPFRDRIHQEVRYALSAQPFEFVPQAAHEQGEVIVLIQLLHEGGQHWYHGIAVFNCERCDTSVSFNVRLRQSAYLAQEAGMWQAHTVISVS